MNQTFGAGATVLTPEQVKLMQQYQLKCQPNITQQLQQIPQLTQMSQMHPMQLQMQFQNQIQNQNQNAFLQQQKQMQQIPQIQPLPIKQVTPQAEPKPKAQSKKQSVAKQTASASTNQAPANPSPQSMQAMQQQQQAQGINQQAFNMQIMQMMSQMQAQIVALNQQITIGVVAQQTQPINYPQMSITPQQPVKKKYSKQAANINPEETPVENTKSNGKDQIAIKRPCSGYIHYSNLQQETVKKQNPELKHSQILQEIGNMWKQLSEEQKAPYQQMAEQDRQRYQNEMAEATARNGGVEIKQLSKKKTMAVVSSSGNKEATKKMPVNCFILWKQQRIKQLKSQPNAPQMTMAELNKLMSQEWQTLPEEEKQKWKDQSKLAQPQDQQAENELAFGQ